MVSNAAVEAADRAAREWKASGVDPIPPGSEAHKVVLPDAAGHLQPLQAGGHRLARARSRARDRLVSLPIWDIAVQTEGKARLQRRVPMPRRSPIRCCARRSSSMAFEEGRHKHVLSNLVAAYGIQLAPEPDIRRAGAIPEWAFMVTGYSECIDSFFAFGLFELAKRSGFFPAGAGRHLRAGDPGGRPPHPVLRQLGGLASPQPCRCGGGRGSS